VKRFVFSSNVAYLFVALGFACATVSVSAQVAVAPDLSSLKGPPKSNPAATKQVDSTERLRHEIWGQSNYGDGYIYGPTNRRSGMTVVDIDLDGDNDFVFPSSISAPQLMRNLGSSSAFFPGGSITLQADDLPEFHTWDLNMDFADLTGDGLPDLVAVVNFENGSGTFTKKVAYYKNEGPRTNPTFSYQRIFATSVQDSGDQRAMWVALGDINGDGLQDVFIAEAWIFATDRQHRVYVGLNQGTRTEPLFPAFLEETDLSSVLPDRIEFTSKELAAGEAVATLPTEPAKSSVAKGTSFSYNLGDIAVYDWDFDGVLDFMFYDRTEGLTLIRNEGTVTDPSWNDTIGTSSVTYIYDHNAIDDITYVEGTFAVDENPDSALPGVDWTRDILVSVNSRLKNYRFFTGEGDDGGYRLNQQNAVAFPAGQGDVDFWDYDGDGDEDMFRTGISSTSSTNLLLFENEGAPYAPAWGEFASGNSITSVPLNSGDSTNDHRNDLFLFADHDADGETSLFVQELDGNISHYQAGAVGKGGATPSFTLIDGAFVDSVDGGHTVTTPRGFTMTDFDQFSDGFSELITAYSYQGDSTLRVIDTFFEQAYDLNDGSLPTNFLPDPFDNDAPIDPLFLEAMTSGDLNLDGRPDLIIAWTADNDFEDTELHFYINEALAPEEHDNFTIPAFRFVYGDRLELPYNTDHRFGRMPKMVDIDADGDNDIFVGHRYPDNHGTNLRSYLRFYRNIVDSGIDIFRQRLVTNDRINLSISEDDHSYLQILNNSGGALEPGNLIYETGDTAPAIDVLQSEGLERNARVFLDVLPTVGANESKAIIVVGDTVDDTLYPTFATLADFAYFVLESEGLPRENIRFYADSSSGLDGDVAGRPTLASLEDSITNWAQGTEKLLVYLVDHGQRDRFRMNATEYLEADDLDSWYDSLQDVAPADRTMITTVIDTCESGSFVDNLQWASGDKNEDEKGAFGPERITMTSAGQGPIEGVALFDQAQYISFSLNFWFNIFNGKDYGQAFDDAKISIEAVNPLQVPQIDGDGDGVANQGGDSANATGHRPGATFDIRVPGVFIGDISADQAVGSNSATLSMGDIVSPFPVEGAGALIVPPNFQRPSLGNDDEQPISGLDFIDFEFDSETDRWEGTYNEFDEGGLFQIQYFVRSGGQFHASPRIGFVDRINLADAWESDDTADDANWIPINSVQGHNFHDNGDADWVRFSPLPNQTATIGVINPGQNAQVVIELYRAEDVLAKDSKGATPVLTMTADDTGEDLVFERNFTTSEQYFLRVTNADSNVSGEGTSYLLLVAVGTGGTSLIPTTLIVSVMNSDGNTPIEGADVMFDGRSVGKSSAEGICHMSVDAYATYQVQAAKSGFVASSSNVAVNNIIEEAVIMMSADATGGEGEGEGEGEGGGELSDLAQDLIDAFDSADADNDDLLSLAEATGAAGGLTEAQFNEIDSDDDGFLSQSELNAQVPAGEGEGEGEGEPPVMQCSGEGPAARLGFSGDLMAVLLSLGLLLWSARALKARPGDVS
jgi:hypothetical protein